MQKDVLIIGSGAGGGPLALTLSQAGFEVVVLEKGPDYQPQEYRHDEISALNSSGFFTPLPNEDPHTLVSRENPKPERTNMGWIALCVGGGTSHMGGFFYRFVEDDFRMRSRFGEFEELVDWPYTYAELEPYYCRAEWEVGVSGAGSTHPIEGLRSRPLPMPPVDCHPLAEVLDNACTDLGIRSFPTARAVNSREYKGRPACSYCDYCAGYGCPTRARGSTQASVLPRAIRTGRCQLIADAMVREITVNRLGHATGCIYFDAEGEEQTIRAKVVCVCCSAIESARLLLLSKSSPFPHGLANSSGLVGRHLQFHAVSGGQGRFHRTPDSGLPLDSRAPFLGRSVMDYYFLPEGVSKLAKGGLLRFGFPHPAPITIAQRLAGLGRSPSPLWGQKLKDALHASFHDYLTLEFEVFHDFIPNRQTFVDLDPRVTDKWGLPAARIHHHAPEHHRLAGEWLVERGLEIFDAMGADELLPGSAGQTSRFLVHGTCRAGQDPDTSVLNSYCQTHEVPNLFVVDGSFMPTSGGAAPTLTILANSFRTADHIVERAKAGDFGSTRASK